MFRRSTNQILAKSLALFNLTGTETRLSYDETVTRVQQCYAFHEEASLKVQGIKGSTSQTQGPDGTLSATTLNSVKMILEGLSRLKTKVMELNPNSFSSMRGGNTDTPMMLLALSQMYQRIIETCHRYKLLAFFYLQPSLGDVDVNFCDLAKLPNLSSGCLTKKQWNELRQCMDTAVRQEC